MVDRVAPIKPRIQPKAAASAGIPPGQAQAKPEAEADEPEKAEEAPADPAPAPDAPKAEKPAGGDPEPAPKKLMAILDSPRPFGIWVDIGTKENPKLVLRRFQKGKTPLTPEEEAACKVDDYVAKNGAEVIYR